MASNNMTEVSPDLKVEFEKFVETTEKRLSDIEQQLEKIYLIEARVNRLYDNR